MAEQQFPRWATTFIADIGNGDPNITDPGASKQDDGWALEKPFLQYMNWLQNFVGIWIENNNKFTIQGTAYQASAGEIVVVDNETGSRTIQLPVLADILDGQWVKILAVDLYSVNSVLVTTGATADIMTVGDDELTLDIDFSMIVFYWDDANTIWKVVFDGVFGRAP